MTPASLVDHLYPHRGDMDLFWTQLWWVSSCSTCHNGFKQKVEAEGAQALDAVAVRLGLPPRGSSASGQVSGPSPTGGGGMARPTWFRRAQIPLTLVAGPPGAGKSTYVRQRAGHQDRVICFDEIATHIFGRFGVERAQARLDAAGIADVLRRRNDLLADLMRKRAASQWPAAWLILSEPTGSHRQWWADHVGARVVLLPTPADECLRRIGSDDQVGDQRGPSARAFVSTWWSQFTPADCDEVANH